MQLTRSSASQAFRRLAIAAAVASTLGIASVATSETAEAFPHHGGFGGHHFARGFGHRGFGHRFGGFGHRYGFRRFGYGGFRHYGYGFRPYRFGYAHCLRRVPTPFGLRLRRFC